MVQVLSHFEAPVAHPDLFVAAVNLPAAADAAVQQQQTMDAKPRTQKQKKAPRMPKDRSCFIIGPDNPLRIALFRMVTSPPFEYFIVACIGVACIVLMLENPDWAQIFVWQCVFSAFEMAFLVVFFVEMVLKLVAFGVVAHKGAYLRSGWNILDFAVVVVSIVAAALSYLLAVDLGFLRAFRAFRAFRLMGRFARTRTVVVVFLKSIPQVVNVIVFSMALWLIFAIMVRRLPLHLVVTASHPQHPPPQGCQLFQGQLGACNDQAVQNKTQCVGTYVNPVTGLSTARVWSNPVWGNFDNVGMALYSIFPMIGVSGWNDKMYALQDAVGVEQQPRRDATPANALYCVFFILVGTWFNSNLFTGAIVDTFQRIESQESSGGLLMTDEQRQWVSLQKQLLNQKPKTLYTIPTHPLREYCFRFAINSYFTYFMASIIIVNIVVLCMDYGGAPDAWQLSLSLANAVFMGIFAFEMVVKLIALGPPQYFRDGWCILDAVIVLGSLADVFMTFLLSGVVSASIIRVLRVFRLLKLVKWSKRLRTVIVSISLAVPAVVNVFCLFFIVVYIYAVIGVAVFGTATYGMALYPPMTFENWGQAVFVLLTVLTGDGWESVMYDLYNPPNNYVGAPAYFFSFLVLSAMILLQMIVGVMLKTFRDVFLVPEGALSADSMESFAQAWSKCDPTNSGYIGCAARHRVAVWWRDADLQAASAACSAGRCAAAAGSGQAQPRRHDALHCAFAAGHSPERARRRLHQLPRPAASAVHHGRAAQLGACCCDARATRPSLKQQRACLQQDDPHALERLEQSWKKKFPQLQHQPTGPTYTVSEYVAAVKLQRAFRRRKASDCWQTPCWRHPPDDARAQAGLSLHEQRRTTKVGCRLNAGCMRPHRTGGRLWGTRTRPGWSPTCWS